MNRITAPTEQAARSPYHPRLVLVAAVLAGLALAGCGAGKATTSSPGSPADTAAVPSDGPSQAMLDRVALSCPPSAPPRAVPSGPAGPPPPGSVEVPPDVEPVAPTAGPEVELNARDWCAGNLHEERVTQALGDLPDPTPATVRTVLNNLGYLDERIHDLKQSGATTRFFLDLRDNGGRLCLEGSAAGESTVVDTCVAPAAGPFTPDERKR
ncbi:hypothetical protein [Kitasatospora sp. NBC_01539]|uniref:hypothetical protein n=1 Tax=Kitasatospora sp. NBC_01539 TaxID=2903577 RepID=UPI0038602D85